MPSNRGRVGRPKLSALAVARRRRNLFRKRRIMPIPANIMKTKRSFYTTEQPGTWDIFYDGTNWQNYRRAGVFHLNDVVNYTEFTELFDAYRITGVKIDFVPVHNSSDPQITTVNYGGVPHLTYVRDYDDATTPNTEQDILEYGAYHRLYLDRMRSIYIKAPKVQAAVKEGSTGAFTGIEESKKYKWLDTRSPTVNHYGIKWYMPTDSMSTSIRIRVYLTYYFQFKRTI